MCTKKERAAAGGWCLLFWLWRNSCRVFDEARPSWSEKVWGASMWEDQRRNHVLGNVSHRWWLCEKANIHRRGQNVMGKSTEEAHIGRGRRVKTCLLVGEILRGRKVEEFKGISINGRSRDPPPLSTRPERGRGRRSKKWREAAGEYLMRSPCPESRFEFLMALINDIMTYLLFNLRY